uniref:CULLIN_2 domain-containing protein n=1 Tax=Steinernema glaseri TaxID=37863 RepID=A0A1I8A7N9_9BILA
MMGDKTFEKNVKKAMNVISGMLTKATKLEKITIPEYMTFLTDIQGACSSNVMNDHKTSEGTAMYEALTKFLRRFISGEAAKISAAGTPEDRLSEYASSWTVFKTFAKFTDGVCRYLNTHWVKPILENNGATAIAEPVEDEKPIFYVYALCMVIWKKVMFVEMPDVITRAALVVMKADRDGVQDAQMDLVKTVVESLVEMGIEFKKHEDDMHMITEEKEEEVDENKLTEADHQMLQTYVRYFENAMLKDTTDYYTAESARAKNKDIIPYMEQTQKRLDEEANRSWHYLHDKLSHVHVQNAVEGAFITARLDMFKAHIRNLLESEQYYVIGLMYSLCSRVEEALKQLMADFTAFINEKGRAAIDKIPPTSNDPNLYMEHVLSTHSTYLDMTEKAFKNDPGFRKAFDEGCALWINKNNITEKGNSLNKSAEFLARYRLLADTSVNEDAETGMITRLKEACGHEYTRVAMRMFGDIRTSKDLSRQFKEKNGDSLQMDANMQVLSTVVWPYSVTYSFDLPREIQIVTDSFQCHYSTVHQGRKLTWAHHLGRAELAAKLSPESKRKYTFTVSAQQAVVLLKYNHADSLALSHIRDETALPDKVLQTVLASFIKVDLLKLPKGVTFDSSLPDTTEFSLNTKYNSKRFKVDLMKLQTAVKGDDGEAMKEQEKMAKSVEEDRKMLLQAAIVRTMKMRKKLKHNLLVTEVVQQVADRFAPKIAMVKQCIDILMEKEYLKRAEDDRESFEYIS